jgi:ATP/maltotriose-dependent transcriptional regulator MalT
MPAAPLAVGLRAKIVRPHLPSDYVVRARLLRLLDRGLERRLTLVVAPGGFGKTTLLTAWDPAGYNLAWVSLDEGDRDVRAFVRTFVGAVQTAIPGFDIGVLSLLNLGELPPSLTIAAHLADALAELPGVAIVLDDYHVAQGDEINELVRLLLARLGPNTRLVISSRHEPSLPVATLRARSELVEIRLEQLTFTDDEAREFLEHAFPRSPTVFDAARLVEHTEGWPAGLRLAVLAMTDVTEGVRPAAGHQVRSAQYAREFLITDVLAAQPTEIRELLLRAAVLDRFCAPLLDALYAEPDASARGAEWLEALNRANLFITLQSADGEWCRFHHLFRDALHRELLARHGSRFVADLHQRASAWFTGQNLIDEAIKHALAAGNDRHAASLVAENLHPLLDREDDPGRLESWLRLLPPEVANRDPAVLLARGWLLFLRNRVGEIPALLRSVEALLDDDTRDEASREALRGTADILWGYVWGGTRSDNAQLLASSAAAIARVPWHWRAARGHAEYLHATAMTRSAREADALRWIEECRATVTHTDGARLGMILRAEAQMHYWSLRIADLAGTAREKTKLGHEQGLRNTATWGHVFSGLASYAWNDLDAAHEHFAAAMANRAHVGMALALDTAFGFAVTLQALGDEDGAEATLFDMAELLDEIGSHEPSNLLASCQARLALARDDIDEADRLLRRMRDDPALSFPSFIEVPMVTRARWLLLQGTRPSLQEATELVERLHQRAALHGHPLGRIRAGAVEALVLQTSGNTEGALAVLEDVMAIAKAGDLLRFFVDFGPPMRRLLVELERQTVPSNAYLALILAAFPATTEPLGTAVPSRPRVDASSVDALTRRELEVLRLLDARMSNKEIARALSIAVETVRKHAVNIYQKLQVGSRREAVSRAHGLGLLRVVPRSTDE